MILISLSLDLFNDIKKYENSNFNVSDYTICPCEFTDLKLKNIILIVQLKYINHNKYIFLWNDFRRGQIILAQGFRKNGILINNSYLSNFKFSSTDSGNSSSNL